MFKIVAKVLSNYHVAGCKLGIFTFLFTIYFYIFQFCHSHYKKPSDVCHVSFARLNASLTEITTEDKGMEP